MPLTYDYNTNITSTRQKLWRPDLMKLCVLSTTSITWSLPSQYRIIISNQQHLTSCQYMGGVDTFDML